MGVNGGTQEGDAVVTGAAVNVVDLNTGLGQTDGIVSFTTCASSLMRARVMVSLLEALDQCGFQAGGVPCVVTGVAGEGRRGHRGKR